jgi:hypothetical protein
MLNYMFKKREIRFFIHLRLKKERNPNVLGGDNGVDWTHNAELYV